MKKTSYFLSVISVLGLFTACTKKTNNDTVITAQVNMEHQMLNFANTKTDVNPKSGKFCSSVDSISRFAAGYSYVIPDSLKDKNLTIYINGWVREQALPMEGTITVAISTSKGVANWSEVKVKNATAQPNTWVEIKDSLTFSSSLYKDSFAEISVFGQKFTGKDRFDLDDLDIKYKFFK